jgi:hypothetical protein
MRTGQCIATVGGLLIVLAPAGAKADPPAPFSEGAGFAAAAGAVLLPSEYGVAIPTADAAGTNFVLGWSLQIPVSAWFGDHTMSHRVVGGLDLLPHADGADWRGRVGYRYAGRHAFAGLGVAIDGAGGSLSPELGLKFLHADKADYDIDMSLHLLARAEIAPESGHVRGATILFGWNLL